VSKTSDCSDRACLFSVGVHTMPYRESSGK
jgi:hypothetical protein